MKRNIFLFIILFLSIGNCLFSTSSNRLSSKLNSYDDNLKINNRVLYKNKLLDYWNLAFISESNLVSNEKFGRENKSYSFDWNFYNNYEKIFPNLFFKYFYAEDKASPDNEKYFINTKIKQAGLEFQLIKKENMFLSTSTAYLDKAEENELKQNTNENGFLNEINLNYFYSDSRFSLQTNNKIYYKKLDREWQKKLDMNLNSNWQSDNDTISFFITSKNEKTPIFLASYTDEQTKNNYMTSMIYEFDFLNFFCFELNEKYTYVNTSYLKDSEKNVIENINDFSFITKFNLSSFYFNASLKKSIKEKDNAKSFGKKNSDSNLLSSEAAWNFFQSDTLAVQYEIELQKKDFENENSYLSNDNLYTFYQLALLMRHDIWKMKTYFSLQKEHEIYLSSQMSANNNKRALYRLKPNLDIYFGNKMMLKQTYSLTADYLRYDYEEFDDDRLFRNAVLKYDYIISNKDLKNYYYLFPKNSLTMEFTFKYEMNDTGILHNDLYEINFEEEFYTISSKLRKSWDKFEILLNPSLDFYDNNIEHNHKLSFNYLLKTNSFLQFKLNAVGKESNDLLYKTEMTVQYTF